jgi:hypothetical protein
MKLMIIGVMIDLIPGVIILTLIMIGVLVVLMIAFALTIMMILMVVIDVTVATGVDRQAISFQSEKLNLSNKKLNSTIYAL